MVRFLLVIPFLIYLIAEFYKVSKARPEYKYRTLTAFAIYIFSYLVATLLVTYTIALGIAFIVALAMGIFIDFIDEPFRWNRYVAYFYGAIYGFVLVLLWLVITQGGQHV